MPTSDFKLLRQREIISILIGDTIIEQTNDNKIIMPRLSGSALCELSTQFGLASSYSWSGGALSRWVYMDNLLGYVNANGTTNDLLCYMFDLQHFKHLFNGTSAEIQEAYQKIVTAVLERINSILFFGKHELKLINGKFIISTIGVTSIIEAPKVMLIDQPYIQGLRERCKDDLKAGNYDSVITKSRTLIEEVLIHILEKNCIEIESKGDLNKLYNQVKQLYKMQQSKDYDGRVNSLLSGLEKIVQAIGEMRNMNSDAHGVGSKRIEVKEREAQLVLNSSITFSEYILSIYSSAKAHH